MGHQNTRIHQGKQNALIVVDQTTNGLLAWNAQRTPQSWHPRRILQRSIHFCHIKQIKQDEGEDFSEDVSKWTSTCPVDLWTYRHEFDQDLWQSVNTKNITTDKKLWSIQIHRFILVLCNLCSLVLVFGRLIGWGQERGREQISNKLDWFGELVSNDNATNT